MLSQIQSLCDRLLSALSAFDTVECVRDSDFVVITNMTDVSVLFNCVKELLGDSNSTADGKFSVGISKLYNGVNQISESYKQAVAICADVLFGSVNNVQVVGEDGIRKRSRLVSEVLSYITENFGNKISVRSAAKKLYVSESHLMHEIKDVLGKTFNECLTEYRMSKAKKMLLEGNLRINEIAVLVGYSDVRYFGRVFNEIIGMSPKEYAENAVTK